MGKLATKIKVSKAADFPIPKKISVADFTELCTIHDLPLDQKTYVRERLDELVTAFSNHMREKKRQPHPRTDRERVSDAQSLIRKGIAKLEKVGPQGLLALEAVASTVSPMLSARWLSERFPDDNYAPRPNTLPMEGRFGSRSPEHGQEFFIEEQTQEARYEFVRSRPKKTTLAVLRNLDDALGRALPRFQQQPGSKGGRKPLLDRHFLILNLAVLWKSLGRQVTMTPNSPFADFVTCVTLGIGWPDGGLVDALPDAVNHWRHLG